MASKLLLQTTGSSVLRTQARFFSQTSPLNRVENVVILGAGLMGSGVAQSAATTGKFNSIVLQDVNQDQLNKAKAQITKSLAKLQELKKVNLSASPEEVTNRITFSTEVKPVSDKNLLVVEAVPEILDLKQEIFRKLSDQFKSNDSVILATNTSSLACRQINIHVERKDRFAGLHFFNPVPLMKLVEIAKTYETKDEIVEELRQFVLDIDHVPVVCKDNQGFIVNRLLGPYMRDALKMLDRGEASVEDIDTAMKLGAGYPMGPFELLDLTGLDTNQRAGEAMAKGDPTYNKYDSKALNELVAQGHLGRKTGKGFYDYSKGQKKK